MKRVFLAFGCIMVILFLHGFLSPLVDRSFVFAAEVSSIEGEWQMVANVKWNFRLTLTQSGASFRGDMYGLSAGDGTTTPVRGTISGDTVEFRRTFGSVIQTYRGQVTLSDSMMNMSGTFTETSSSGTYTWSARKAAPQQRVELELTYPAGKSPKVFTNGWVFGARCISRVGDKEQDLSNKVVWSGTASFHPARGEQSRPTFSRAGKHSIALSCTVGKEVVKKTFEIDAVSPDAYAHVGNMAAAWDSHGCPGCPHPVTGPILAGSGVVFIKGLPAARKGDPGQHFTCCGANTFVIAEGDPEVLIDGKPAARFGDKTQHCGGVGKITKATLDVNRPPSNSMEEALKKSADWNEPLCRDLAEKLKNRSKLSDAEYSQLLEKIRSIRLALQNAREFWGSWHTYYARLSRIDPAFTPFVDGIRKKEAEISKVMNILDGKR